MAAAIVAVLAGVVSLGRPEAKARMEARQTGKGAARIVRFYASTGASEPGQRVQLCYAVENARSVTISPLMNGQLPVRNDCLQVTPQHTTHFTLMAEGYDGAVVSKSFTLVVQVVTPATPERRTLVAGR